MRSRNRRRLFWTLTALSIYFLVWFVVFAMSSNTPGNQLAGCEDGSSCLDETDVGRALTLAGFVFWGLSAYFVWRMKPTRRTRREYYWRETSPEAPRSESRPFAHRALGGVLMLVVAGPLGAGTLIGFGRLLTPEAEDLSSAWPLLASFPLSAYPIGSARDPM